MHAPITGLGAMGLSRDLGERARAPEDWSFAGLGRSIPVAEAVHGL